MEKLDGEVKDKGLVFLNECGLDPGIDIMSTMKVVHEAQEKGVKVVGYESYCGGLPIAEHADNPLGYKFTWNPGAAIKASKNKATYKKYGKVNIYTLLK
jgi:saccharopine dehydrogenase-like NADP-dependent oxidoreductase